MKKDLTISLDNVYGLPMGENCVFRISRCIK